MLVLRELGIPRETPDDDERLRPPKLPAPDLKERVRKKTKDLLIEDELRRRRCVQLCSLVSVLIAFSVSGTDNGGHAFHRVQKMTMIAEGAEAKRVEDAVAEKKRKMEEKERWEGAFASCFHFALSQMTQALLPAQRRAKTACTTGGTSTRSGKRRRRVRRFSVEASLVPVARP